MGLIGKITNQINLYKKVSELVEKAPTIQGLQPLPKLEEKKISAVPLKEKNSNFSIKKARVIIDLIPQNDLRLEEVYATEMNSNKEYYVIPTMTYLWLINMEGYVRYNYDSLHAEMIQDRFLSKVINLSGFILDIIGSDNEIDNFINIINDKEYRQKVINEKIEFYGQNQKEYILNDFGAGISYDDNYNFIFYTGTESKKYNVKDLENYEILVDNNCIQQRRTKRQEILNASKNFCYEIKIKITPKKENSFELPVLIQGNGMQKMYETSSDVYRETMEFSRNIMKIIDDSYEFAIYGQPK